MKNLFRSSLSLILGFNVLVLVSCGILTTDSVIESQPNSNVASREIKHAMGTTKVPKTPNRVVVLTNEATDNVLGLGVKPVGAVQSWWGRSLF